VDAGPDNFRTMVSQIGESEVDLDFSTVELANRTGLMAIMTNS
jgi:hypothetical protein